MILGHRGIILKNEMDFCSMKKLVIKTTFLNCAICPSNSMWCQGKGILNFSYFNLKCKSKWWVGIVSFIFVSLASNASGLILEILRCSATWWSQDRRVQNSGLHSGVRKIHCGVGKETIRIEGSSTAVQCTCDCCLPSCLHPEWLLLDFLLPVLLPR